MISIFWHDIVSVLYLFHYVEVVADVVRFTVLGEEKTTNHPTQS